MAGKVKEQIFLEYSTHKVTTRSKKVVLELENDYQDDNYHYHYHHHPCPICGCESVEELNDSQPQKLSPVQVDLFHNLILALTLEVGGSGDDLPPIDQEDVQNFSCQKCIAKFQMLESIQEEISVLENRVEEILSQIRKTICDRRGISMPNLQGSDVTEPEMATRSTFSDMQEEGEDSLTSTLFMDEEEHDNDNYIDIKPVILFHDEVEVDDEEHELLDDQDDGISQDDDPLGGVEVYDINNQDHDESSTNKSRKCKARTIYSANDDNVDYDDGHGEYWSNAELDKVDTDLDSDTDELDLDYETRQKRYQHKRQGIPSSTKVQKQKRDTNICVEQVLNLDIDMETHRSEKHILYCETCDKNFSTEQALNDHRKQVHLQGIRFKCGNCRKGFYKLINLKRHINARNACKVRLGKKFRLDKELQRKGNFFCYICQRQFSSKRTLRDHTAHIHNGEKIIRCPYKKCATRKFYVESSLQRHLRIHHPSDESDKICTICNEKFFTVLQKRAHMRSTHTCEFCNKSFPNKTSLHKHKKTHTGSRPYLCTKCGDKFKVADSLKSHLQFICNPDKDELERVRKLRQERLKELNAKRKSSQHKCKFCLKSYVFKERLVLHISNCHRDVSNE